MTPARAIEMIDRQIASHGQPVTLRRNVPSAPPIEAAVSAFVRDYKPDELLGGLLQGDSAVTISPTALVGTAFAEAIPKRLDKVVFAGRPRTVESVDPVSIGGVYVRFNLQVRG